MLQFGELPGAYVRNVAVAGRLIGRNGRFFDTHELISKPLTRELFCALTGEPWPFLAPVFGARSFRTGIKALQRHAGAP